MKRKEVAIGVSGVGLAIIALVAVIIVWSAVDNLGKKANDLEQRVTATEDTVEELSDKVDDLEQRLSATEEKADDLEQNLTATEEKADDLEQRLASIENRDWHTVGDFTLSLSKTSQEFYIQGEEWRLNFIFNQVVAGIQIGYNLRVYDASGNIVGGLSGIELSDIVNEHCILNIREGQGDFTVEISGMASDFTFSFTVEEFY